jgi:hypothetical protein
VDAGARPIIIVSTRLPEPLGDGDGRICAGVISRVESERGADPLVVLGNLPAPPPGGRWKAVPGAGRGAGALWYTPGPIGVSGTTGAACALGTLLVADVDVFPRAKR